MNSFFHQLFFSGEFLALLSAILWAKAIILFRLSGKTIHPLSLNLTKNTISLLFVGLTMAFLGKELFLAVPWPTYGLFLLSGIIGLGLSDTLLFVSLNRLGATRLAIINCSYSPFIIILSVIFLGERLSLLQGAGVILILISVWILSSGEKIKPSSRQNVFWGILIGLTAMMSQAVSIVMIKPALNQLPLLWSTQLRTAGGIIFLGLVFLFHPQRSNILKPVFRPSSWKYILPASFLGSYLAIIAWLGGMKYTLVSVAAVINQTSIIFIFIFGIIFLKEKVKGAYLVAFFIGLIGLGLVTFF